MKPYKTKVHVTDLALTVSEDDFAEFGLVDLPCGQEIMVIDRVCKNTGLRENDGSLAFADKGFWTRAKVVGGKHDGIEGMFLDCGFTGCFDDPS